MRRLSPPARGYLLFICGIATALLAYSIGHYQGAVPLYWLVIWFVGFLLADYFEVLFEVSGNRIALTIADAIIIFMCAVGEFSAVGIVALGTVCVEFLRQRSLSRLIFNTAQRTIAVFLMTLVYLALKPTGAVPFSTPLQMLVFLAVATTFYLASTLIVGIMVALSTKRPIYRVYREGIAPFEWIHLLTLPIGGLMAAHWFTDRWLLVFDIVILLIAQRSFLTVAQLQTESQRRQQLADERERLLEELKAQQEELIRASKLSALGTFAAGIAHEFNNLLTVIQGQAQLGLVTNAQDDMRNALSMTVNACRRGASITKGLLTFARQGESQRTMTMIGELVDDTIKMVEYDFEKENIHIMRQIAPVPPTSCDPGQIVQVLLNMLTNARDAMQPLGGGLITMHLRQEDAQIALSIADTGSGMSPEIQRQIFQPFVTTKGAKGTGLGLAICYGIVEGHGGSIHVSSRLDKGTTMTIYLPIVESLETTLPTKLANHKTKRDTIRA